MPFWYGGGYPGLYHPPIPPLPPIPPRPGEAEDLAVEIAATVVTRFLLPPSAVVGRVTSRASVVVARKTLTPSEWVVEQVTVPMHMTTTALVTRRH